MSHHYNLFPPGLATDRNVPDHDLPPRIPAKEPLIFDFKEALRLGPYTPSVISSTSSVYSTPRSHQEAKPSQWLLPPQLTPQPTRPTQLVPPPVPERVEMTSASKPQNQGLRLCSSTGSAGDRVAERMTEYSTLVKTLPRGFDSLANELLDNCQILSLIEYALGESMRNGRSLPPDMVSVLERKFRAAHSAFRLLEQLITKQVEQERKGGMSRWFGKKFEDSGADRLISILAKAQEDLRMSGYMFPWENGSDGLGTEGIGASELRVILEASNVRRKPFQFAATASPTTSRSDASIHQQRPQETRIESVLSTQPSLPSIPGPHSQKNNLGYSLPLRNESLRVDSGALISSMEDPRTPATVYTNDSGESYFENQFPIPRHGLQGVPESAVSIQRPSRELEELCGDLLTLDLENSKITRIESEQFTLPRHRPRSTVDADKANAHGALVAAISAKDHKRVAYLLDRGVSPNDPTGVHSLNEAVRVRDAESLRLLLAYGADPNDADIDGMGPLALAAKNLFLYGAMVLLKYGADPNFRPNVDVDAPMTVPAMSGDLKMMHLFLMYGGKGGQSTAAGETLLIGAINKKVSMTLIDLLLGYGADPNEKNREGKTALFEAITSARADIVKALLDKGADPNLPGPKHMLWPSTYQPACLQLLLDAGATPKKAPGTMELAASLNNIESIRILLKAGVNPNTKKDGVYTPLCTSIRDNRPDIMQLLLSNGADPNVPASEYPCFKCVTHHREYFLPKIVAAGGNLRSPKGILETAVSSNNTNALKWLLEQGLDPNEKSAAGHTPLTSAIRDARIDVVQVLLERGANPNVRGQDWPVCMAVHDPKILKLILSRLREPRAFKGIMEMAVAANQIDSVRLLLAAGVSVEDRNGGVFSPLTSALRDRRREIVEFLINEAGADVNAPGEHLPIVKSLRRCTGEAHQVMIDMLLEKGADPNKVYRGWNGIMQALENGDAAILKKLVDKAGVDLEAKDEMGRTVLEIAVSREWKEAVVILKGRRI